MGGKSTAVGLLGLGLLGTHLFSSDSGQVIRNAISDVNGAPDPKDAHKALLQFGALLAFVTVAVIISSASDTAGTAFVGFFILLWVLWGMTHIQGGVLKGFNNALGGTGQRAANSVVSSSAAQRAGAAGAKAAAAIR